MLSSSHTKQNILATKKYELQYAAIQICIIVIPNGVLGSVIAYSICSVYNTVFMWRK